MNPDNLTSLSSPNKSDNDWLNRPWISWLSILIRPRVAIREIIDYDPDSYVILLASFLGISTGINIFFASLIRVADINNYIFIITILMSLIFGAIGGIIYIFLGGYIFRGVGSICGCHEN